MTAAVAFGISGSAFALAAGPARFAAIALLAVALAALTVAELENSAGEAFLSIELAPAPLRGRYLSLFKTSMALQQALGPALVTVALVQLGCAGWLVLALTSATAALASRQLSARNPRRHTRADGQASASPSPDPL